MKLRAIRRKVATIAGIIMAIVSLVWLLVIDTKGKAEVKWAYGAMLMLISACATMLCSYFLGNPESKAWLIFDILSPIFQVGFVASQFALIINHGGVVSVGSKLSAFGTNVLPILVLIVGILGVIVTIGSLVIDIILYNKIDKHSAF